MRATFAFVAVVVSCTSFAQAPAYPSKPIRAIHGFVPGGNVDIIARALGLPMSEILGQQLVVDGRPGAGGSVAGNLVAKAEPDGYTLFAMASGHSVAPALYRALPYDAGDDFTMISLIATFPFVIAVAPNHPAKGLADLVRLFDTPAGVAAFVQGGRLRPLAVTFPTRWSNWPDVPTVAETVAPGFDVKGWIALAAPKNLPATIRARLAQAVHQALARPDVIERFKQIGSGVAPTQPDETRAFLATEVERWKKLVQDAKIPPQD